MIFVVSHHWALPGKEEELTRRLHGTAEKMRKYPGFLSRTNIQALDRIQHTCPLHPGILE